MIQFINKQFLEVVATTFSDTESIIEGGKVLREYNENCLSKPCIEFHYNASVLRFTPVKTITIFQLNPTVKMT